MRQPSRSALIALAAVLSFSAAACHKPPQFTTRSYYVADGGGGPARSLGCQNGDKTGRMTMFFGAPASVSGTYGATLWGAPNRTTASVAATAREFARGYAACRQSSSYRLLIGVGTSNSTIDIRSDAWVQAHGRAWSAMVKSLSDWSERYYPGAIRFYGAWDAEPSWSHFQKANLWMHGYDAYPGARPLFANFSADGCPRESATNGGCDNGWNQFRVWHLAWDHDPALPVPQIYATSGANAKQWLMIDIYGVREQNDGLYFFGVMSQQTACAQSGGCSGTNATPHQASDLLLSELDCCSSTRQAQIYSMTDVGWHS